MDANFFTIRGYQKSGTNWLCNLLNLHPNVSCNGEFHFQILKNAVIKYLDNGFRKRFSPIVLSQYEEMVKACLKDKVASDQITWYGDRTPTGLQPVIIKNIPQFFIYRDGRDVVISQAYHRLRHTHAGLENAPAEFKRVFDRHPAMVDKLTLFQKDTDYFEKNPLELLNSESYLRESARNWANFIEKNLSAVKKSEEGSIHTRVCMVKYEDLHRNTWVELERIYGFLNLNAEDAKPLNEKTSPGFKKTDNLSLYRKGIAGEWNRFFDVEKLNWFKEEAGSQMEKLGYEI